MNQRKPVELPIIKIWRDPRIVDADISDMPNIACSESKLTLDHQLLEILRGLDLDTNRADAIEVINRAFDLVKMEHLDLALCLIMEKITDKADAECFGWLLRGKVESLRELAERVGMTAPGILKRVKKLEAHLRGILQGKFTSSTS
jgi:hypothetical protein